MLAFTSAVTRCGLSIRLFERRRQANYQDRCVWVKEKVHSTTGLREWQSAKFCLRSRAESTSKLFETPSDWLATSFPVSKSLSSLYYRLKANHSTGQWEFVKKGDAPVVGITKLDGVTLEDLKRPRKQVVPQELLEASPSTTATEVGSTPASSGSS